MVNIYEILQRAASLKEETVLNSISPERAGGIMYDTLLALNDLWLQQGSALVISKIYASVAAMEADTAPVSDLTGKPLRPGQIVVIASSDSDNGSVYRYNGTDAPSWSLVGAIGNLTPVDSLDSDSTTLPLAAHQGKVLDGKISQLGQEITERYGAYENNPEWVRVVTDNDGRVLYGVKIDGKFYFGADCPPQVQEYVQAQIDAIGIDALFATKVDKVTGKSLINADYASAQDATENPEWLQVVTDSEDKVLEGIDKRGNKVQNLPLKTPFNEILYTENPEWLEVKIDADGKIIEGTKKDGTKVYFGVPDDIKEYIKDYIGDKFLNRTAYQTHLASTLGFARRSTWDSEHDYLPVDWVAPLVFLHISDAHIGGSTYRPQIYNAVKALNKLSVNEKNNGMDAKFMIATGDICNNNYAEDISNFTQAVAGANKPVLIAIGNHDVGNSKTKSICGTDAQVYTKFISPYIDDWDLATENEGTPHPSGKCYYFKDFADEKIRLIVLYEYESDFELDPNDSSKLKYQRGYRAFRQAQIDWLIDSLMKTPDDYGVMIAKHQQENQRGYSENPFNSVLTYGGGDQFTYVDKDIIAEIVDAFINKTSLTKDYAQTGEVVTTLSVDVDFSNKESTEFICYLSGHNHCDGISFLKDFSNQLELNIGCDNTHYTHSSDMLQQKDTLSEDLINVYSIDRNNKCICVVRIGADMSCMAQHRVCERISYIVN